MGILDNVDSPEMAFAMGLLNASGPSRMPVSLGQVLGAGLQSSNEAKREQLKAAREKQLMAMHDMEMARMKKSQEDTQKIKDFFAGGLGQFVQSPQQQAIADGGPTVENAAKIPTLMPKIDRDGMYGAMINSGIPELATSGLTGYASLDDKREAAANRKEEFAARIQAQKEAQAAAQQQRMDMFMMQQQGRQDLARLGASLRQPDEPKPMTAQQEAKYRGTIADDYRAVMDAQKSLTEITGSAKAVREAPGLDSITGVINSRLPSIFADATSAEARLANLKGKVTQLGKVAASAGGAIGAVANAEWKIMADMIAAIDPRNKEEMLRQIELVEQRAETAARSIADAYERQYGADFEKYPQFRIGGQAQAEKFDTMPKASMYKGRKIKGDDGTVYRSNGLTWVKE